MTLTVYTDGASRGNPGISSYGFVVFDEEKKLIYKEGKYIGVNTNNYAEHTAVLKAFEYIIKKRKRTKKLHFFMDSKLVAEQLSGRYKVKSQTLLPLVRLTKSLEAMFEQVIYKHIPRSMNALADEQANIALDKLP